jgi:hypothetical protein
VLQAQQVLLGIQAAACGQGDVLKELKVLLVR